jgi:two-component system sensor histidine kinase TctE
MASSSLRLQLLVWLLVPLGGVVAANTWLSHRTARITAGTVTDRTLLASARSLAEQLEVRDGRVDAVILPAALGMFASEHRDHVYYRIIAPDGRLVAGSADLPEPGEAVTGQIPRYYDAGFRGLSLRLVAIRQPLLMSGDARDALVFVGQTVRGREAMTDTLWLGNLRQQTLLVVLAAALSWLGLQRGLLPLLRLRNAVIGRRPDELAPFRVESVQRELKPLVSSLNEYMARLQRGLAARRRFNANAAHQLRTPLALIRAQAGYALGDSSELERRDALRAILLTATEMTRLTNQLLTLSKAEADGRPLRGEPVDLVALAKRVLEELAGAALTRDIDLGFETDGAQVIAWGDALMLRELVVNLVDNALRYTPRGGVVTVVTGTEHGLAGLRVQDNGPGIPIAERDQVFERFYRVRGREGDGSGLGLAIVREIVRAAGGTISLDDPPAATGLVVTVRLPIDGRA